MSLNESMINLLTNYTAIGQDQYHTLIIIIIIIIIVIIIILIIIKDFTTTFLVLDILHSLLIFIYNLNFKFISFY